jgi:hypothetical protein
MMKLIATAINKELDSGRGYDEIYIRWRNCVVYCAMNRAKGSATDAAKFLRVHRNTLAMWLREMHEAGIKTSEYEALKGLAGTISGEVPSSAPPD